VDLKQNFKEEVAAVSHNMLQRVMQNFQKHMGESVDKGRQFHGSKCCNQNALS